MYERVFVKPGWDTHIVEREHGMTVDHPEELAAYLLEFTCAATGGRLYTDMNRWPV